MDGDHILADIPYVPQNSLFTAYTFSFFEMLLPYDSVLRRLRCNGPEETITKANETSLKFTLTQVRLQCQSAVFSLYGSIHTPYLEIEWRPVRVSL